LPRLSSSLLSTTAILTLRLDSYRRFNPRKGQTTLSKNFWDGTLSPVTNISVGDSINGSLSYDYDSSQWVIIFNDVTKAQISLGVNDLGMTTTGMHPYLAYEMWSPDPTQPTCDCSSYVPRDCTFTNIITKYTATLSM